VVYSCEVHSADICCASVADVCDQVGLVVAL